MSRWTRYGISSFIVIYGIAILSWSVPRPSKLQEAVSDFFKPALLFSGLWQCWDMFAPEPLSVSSHLEAEVTLASGEVKTWVFPRVEDFQGFEKYTKERYRKWANDRIRLDEYSLAWPDTARFVARQFKDPANPPRKVRLIRYWTQIKLPENGVAGPVPERQKHENRFVFFTHELGEGGRS